jgi:hypothetical protein
MEDSPATDPSKAGKLNEQNAANKPVSGERPDQGKAPAPDHYDPNGQAKVESATLPVQDVAGAKYKHAVLAQPPEDLTGLKLEGRAKIAAGVTAVIKSMAFSWGEEASPAAPRAC